MRSLCDACADSSPQAVATASARWSTRTDPRTGKTYYVNLDTKETTWTKPKAAATGKIPNARWTTRTDPRTGKDTKETTDGRAKDTKETTWAKPAAKSLNTTHDAGRRDKHRRRAPARSGKSTTVAAVAAVEESEIQNPAWHYI